MTNPKLRHSEENEPIILKLVDDSKDNPMIHLQYVKTISGDKAEAIMKGAIEAPKKDERDKEKFDDNVKKKIIELHTNRKKSFKEIAKILTGEGIKISHTTVSHLFVSHLFKEMTLQGMLKPTLT
ncbi:MAG: hypothetical protein KBS95_03490 [Alistipes sp.]|nr:hypothetical protein [Candidatus Alistipes equi]